MGELTLYLLGPARIELDKAVIEVKPRKALALLIYLAVTGEHQARDTLATLLWPQSDQRGARRSLRNRLSELKLILGDEWLEISRESVCLRAGFGLDVNHFQQLLVDEEQNLQNLIAATDLYRGDFLTGFTLPDCPEFDEWQFFQTESLRQSLASALENLVGGLREQDDYATGVAHARRRLVLDPLHEPTHQQLMRLYAQTGQQAAALRQYEQCRQVLEDELGISPAQETETLYQDIQAGKFVPKKQPPQAWPQARPRPKHNLPIQTSTFIGRESEINAIKQLLLEEPGCRLLNLVGPGGIGKTRLALATAVQLRDSFPDGVFFIPLAPVSEPESIVPAIAESLRLTFYGNVEPKAHLLDYLSRRQLLLVVDNFEHLLDGATLLSEIVSRAADVSILATSRERLNLQEEWVFAVHGLNFPANDGRILDTYSAVDLFLRRARQTKSDFVPTEADIADISRICQLVEGMPLGIELAAPWIKLLSCREIAAEIERSLDFLETAVQNVPDRHRSLRVVFEQTWERLSAKDKSVLRQLSVFRGGCTRDAAEQVAGATLPILSLLVDRALLRRSNTGRYELHELIRQYAARELSQIKETETTQDVHSTYFADFLQQCENDLKGSRQKEAAEEIAADFENILKAWNWAVEQAHIELLAKAVGGLGLTYEWNGRYLEGERICAYASGKLKESKTAQGQRIVVNLLIWQASFSVVLGENEQASQLLYQAETLIKSSAFATQDTHPERTAILTVQGTVAYHQGEFEKTRQLFEQSLASYRRRGDRWQEAKTLLALEKFSRNLLESGSLKQYLHEILASKELVLQSLAIFRSFEDHANIARGLLGLGNVHLMLGQANEAQLALEECIRLCKALGHRNNTTLNLAIGALGLVKGMHFGLYEQMEKEGQILIDLAQELGFSEGRMLGSSLVGNVALVQGAYEETEQIFQEILSSLNQQKGDRNYMASTLALLGHATHKLGRNVQMQQYLTQSLQITAEIRAVRGAGYGLPLAALLFADAGDVERAIEIQALAWSLPSIANSRWWEDAAGQQLTKAASTLPSNIVAAAQARGQKRNLWATIDELLAIFVGTLG